MLSFAMQGGICITDQEFLEKNFCSFEHDCLGKDKDGHRYEQCSKARKETPAKFGKKIEQDSDCSRFEEICKEPTKNFEEAREHKL